MRWLALALSIGILAALICTYGFEAAQADSVIDGITFLFTLAATLVVGWLLAWKRPSNPIGWLFIAFTGLFALQVPAVILGGALSDVAPAVTGWLYWYGWEREDTWSWLPSIGILLTQIPLHFPNGKLPSPRWRWFRWFSIIGLIVACLALSTSPQEVAPDVANPTYIAGFGQDAVMQLAVFVGLLATTFIGGIASLFVRYRGADPVQRAQLRWVLWAVGIAFGTLMLSWLINSGPFAGLVQALVLGAYGLIPISIGIAVLRYRLYDIDRIISRTASYAVVTIVVIGTYLIVVTSATLLLPNLPAVGVALATLAAAALFLPALRLVQRWVDRRFNREQYDALKVVDAFGERLRNGADPHTAAAELVAAVEQTLQPASVGVWTVGAVR